MTPYERALKAVESNYCGTCGCLEENCICEECRNCQELWMPIDLAYGICPDCEKEGDEHDRRKSNPATH